MHDVFGGFGFFVMGMSKPSTMGSIEVTVGDVGFFKHPLEDLQGSYVVRYDVSLEDVLVLSGNVQLVLGCISPQVDISPEKALVFVLIDFKSASNGLEEGLSAEYEVFEGKDTV